VPVRELAVAGNRLGGEHDLVKQFIRSYWKAFPC
jgi:hypothetical protein